MKSNSLISSILAVPDENRDTKNRIPGLAGPSAQGRLLDLGAARGEHASMAEFSADHELQIALEHFKAGRIADAERACRRVSADHPRYADSVLLLGVMAGRAGRLAEGISWLGKAVSLSPGRADVWLQLGMLQRKSGDFRLAIQSFQQAAALNPEDAQIQLALANSFQLTGNYDQSILCYQRALALAPTLSSRTTICCWRCCTIPLRHRNRCLLNTRAGTACTPSRWRS